jgi:uncharacterized membrane protein
MYAAVTALIFAIVAILHFVRLLKRLPVHVGPHSVPMSLSWAGLAVSGLLAIWGFTQ